MGDSHTVRYGLYGEFERGNISNNSLVFPANPDGTQASTTPINIFDATRLLARTWSAYLQDEWSIGDKWTVNYGVRGDQLPVVPHRKPAEPACRPGLSGHRQHDRACRLFALLHAAGHRDDRRPPISRAFNGTTNQLPERRQQHCRWSERSNYYDLGVSQKIGSTLTLGVDAYYRKVQPPAGRRPVRHGAGLLHLQLRLRPHPWCWNSPPTTTAARFRRTSTLP